jgi:hypothetical protein
MAVGAAKSIGAEGDVLLDALHVLQTRITVRQIGRIVGLPNWQRQRISEIVWRLSSTISAGPLEAMNRSGGPPEVAPRPPRAGIIAGLVMALGAVAILTPRWSGVIGLEAEGVGAAVVLALGFTTLWLIMRQGTLGR